MTKNTFLVLFGLLIGCGGGVALQAARAQPFAPNTSAPRWEQTCQPIPGDLDSTVRKAGFEGWEIAALTASADHYASSFVCFKRPMPGAR